MSTLVAKTLMIIVILSVALYMIGIIISKYVQVMYYKTIERERERACVCVCVHTNK